MKKTFLLLAIASMINASCTKKENTINSNTTIGPSNPAFIVNGLSGITFINNYQTYTTLHLSVLYQDSVQENVVLSLTGLPSGIGMDDTWQNSGVPSFNTDLTIFDTLGEGAAPGTYTLTLTATTTSGKKKTYPMNLRVFAMPTTFLGNYNHCRMPCGASNAYYSDSLYADAAVRNKIWFNNFGNTGSRAYGTLGFDGVMTIPAQTIGGISYSGSGTVNVNTHQLVFNVHAGTASCSITMNNI
jgi:hypothetical protein